MTSHDQCFSIRDLCLCLSFVFALVRDFVCLHPRWLPSNPTRFQRKIISQMMMMLLVMAFEMWLVVKCHFSTTISLFINLICLEHLSFINHVKHNSHLKCNQKLKETVFFQGRTKVVIILKNTMTTGWSYSQNNRVGWGCYSHQS